MSRRLIWILTGFGGGVVVLVVSRALGMSEGASLIGYATALYIHVALRVTERDDT